MRLREQANRLSEAFWRADGGTPDTPRQQVRTLSGIQAERRVLRAWIRASEAKKKRLDEDVELQSGRMSRVGTVATVSVSRLAVWLKSYPEQRRSRPEQSALRQQGGDARLVQEKGRGVECNRHPCGVLACGSSEKVVLLSGPTKSELATSISSASFPFQDD
ncbi:hypothetical protein PC114_g14688 [Phytophthora cactorum]|nr:hypothetical protein PC112_g15613 [Phytophthora cactorum]KAG2897364.1 hypothetical protein PC114_g14688 [Phytophthora cactorum]